MMMMMMDLELEERVVSKMLDEGPGTHGLALLLAGGVEQLQLGVVGMQLGHCHGRILFCRVLACFKFTVFVLWGRQFP